MGGGAHTVLNLGAMRKLGTLLIIVNCKTPSFTMLFIFIWSQTIATSLAPTRWQSATRTTVLDRSDQRAMVVPSSENQQRKSKIQKKYSKSNCYKHIPGYPGSIRVRCNSKCTALVTVTGDDCSVGGAHCRIFTFPGTLRDAHAPRQLAHGNFLDGRQSDRVDHRNAI